MGVTEGDGGGGEGGWARWGFLIRTLYLVSTKNKIKTVVRLSPSRPSPPGDGVCTETAG